MSANLKITGGSHQIRKAQLLQLSILKQNLTDDVITKKAGFDNKQVHMFWTEKGLAIVVPRKEDKCYITLNDASVTIPSKNNFQDRNTYSTFGEFQSIIMINWNDGAREHLKMLYRAMSDAFIEIASYFKDLNTRRSAENLFGTLKPNLMQLTRDVRFVIVGMIMYKLPVPDMYFKYMFMELNFESFRYPCELCAPLRAFYDDYLNSGICKYKEVDGMTVLDYIDGFNNDRIGVYTGGSTLVTFGDIKRAPTVKVDYINVFTSILNSQPKNEFTMESDEVSVFPNDGLKMKTDETKDDDTSSQTSTSSFRDKYNITSA